MTKSFWSVDVEAGELRYSCKAVPHPFRFICGKCGEGVIGDDDGWRDCPDCGARLVGAVEIENQPSPFLPVFGNVSREELLARGHL